MGRCNSFAALPRAPEWGAQAREDEDTKNLASAALTIAADPSDDDKESLPPALRSMFFDRLPDIMLRIHHAWRGLEVPDYASQAAPGIGRKVGRNEPCPCGSGKKFKRCCGSPEQRDLH